MVRNLESSADWVLTKPTTGIAGCCALAATGHAAALPRPAMNARRRILDPSRWISEPYHNDGCRERWFPLVPVFAALRKSASDAVDGSSTGATSAIDVGAVRALMIRRS